MIDIEENDDDELYCTPVSSTNLASVFNTTMLPIHPGNDASLTYKPQKQPNAKIDHSTMNAKPKYQSTVLLFKEVHVFQLINKEYSPTGKCGFALIGNEQVCVFQLLIYKQKNNILSTTKIIPNFEIKIQKNNYVTIVDDKKLTWTIHMNNEKDLNDFSKIINDKCKCKIIKPEEANEKDDSTEVLFKNKKENLPIIFVKKQDEESVDKEIAPNKEPTIVKTEIEPNKIDSDTSDTAEATKKADILSRVAKMGKEIVPKAPASDSNDGEDPNKNNPCNQTIKNEITPVPEDTTQVEEKKNITNILPKEAYADVPLQTYYSIVQSNPAVQQFVPMSQEKYEQLKSPLNQIIPPYQECQPKVVFSSTQLSPDQLNMYFVENRTHSSEMRMGLMKLQSGIDDIMKMIKKTSYTKYDSSTQTESGFLVDITIENKRLVNLIMEHEKNIAGLKANCDTYKKKNDELIRQETDHSYEIATLTQETARCAYEEHKLNLQVKEQQVQLSHQTAKITDYEDKLHKANVEYLQCIHVKKQKLPEIKDSIKEQMNLFYNEACGIFRGETTYDGNQIKKILAPAIIDNTYKILGIINDVFNVAES